MTAPQAILGTPPAALDGVLSGLVRLYRDLDLDDEARQSRGVHANQITDAQLRLLTTLMAWIRPSVDAERERWEREAAEDHAEAEARVWADLLHETAPRKESGWDEVPA